MPIPMTAAEQMLYDRARTYEEAASAAIYYLSRASREHGPMTQVCGPISTGSLGSREANIARLTRAIEVCETNGHTVFNQLMFEDMVRRFSPDHGPENYDWQILQTFYTRVLNENYVDTLLFLPDWRTSKGATFEWALGESFKLDVKEYPLEWLQADI